jgi:hypothetical protein
MLSAAIILSGETEKLFFDSLNTMDGVDWNAIYCRDNKAPRQLNQALIFSSPEIIPKICDVLVVLDHEFCRFDYLSTAIRNGCHLFLSDKLNLNTEERKQLILLAKEGGTYIQIQNDFLFQPLHKKIITRNKVTSYIEIKQSVQSEPDNLKEVLLNNLLLILKVAGAPVNKMNVFCGTAPSKQPDILNIHINFTNGSTASLTLLYSGNQRIHKLYIYQNGEKSYFDFVQNKITEYPGNPAKTEPLVRPSTIPDQINEFIKNAEGKSPPIYSLSDEIEVFLLLEKIKGKFELHSVTF